VYERCLVASKVLALSVRALPGGFEQRYGHRVYLAETFVDLSRFAGTCYRAANWLWGALHAAGARGDCERRIGTGLSTLVSRVQHAEPESQCSPKPDLTPTF
jgi:hypothetical protein